MVVLNLMVMKQTSPEDLPLFAHSRHVYTVSDLLQKINDTLDERFEFVWADFGEVHEWEFCFECGACVAQCPAARFSERFNPRVILQDVLLGRGDALLAADSPIWLCTNCYSCYERCPQDVRPIEVIVALKNLANRKGVAPDAVTVLTKNILKTGVAGVVTPVVHKTRERLGLKPLKDVPVEELRKLLDD